MNKTMFQNLCWQMFVDAMRKDPDCGTEQVSVRMTGQPVQLHTGSLENAVKSVQPGLDVASLHAEIVVESKLVDPVSAGHIPDTVFSPIQTAAWDTHHQVDPIRHVSRLVHGQGSHLSTFASAR